MNRPNLVRVAQTDGTRSREAPDVPGHVLIRIGIRFQSVQVIRKQLERRNGGTHSINHVQGI